MLMSLFRKQTIVCTSTSLVHISQICDRRIKNVSDEIQEGAEIKVKVIDVDQQGKVKLSRKEALKDAVAAE